MRQIMYESSSWVENLTGTDFGCQPLKPHAHVTTSQNMDIDGSTKRNRSQKIKRNRLVFHCF